MASPHDSDWLMGVRDDARVRLFCLPSAGTGASSFSRWRSRLSRDVDVCPLMLPGREARMGEEPYQDLDELVLDAADALEDVLDRPYALAGYSMGALGAFELARELRRRGHPPPVHLLVAACMAPHHREDVQFVHLPDEAFVRAIQANYQTPPEMFADPDVLALFMPVLRADFTVLEAYAHQPEAPLEAPITAWFGASDPSVTREKVAAWGEHTAAAFALCELDAGHFFQDDPRFVANIDAVLAPYCARP